LRILHIFLLYLRGGAFSLF